MKSCCVHHTIPDILDTTLLIVSLLFCVYHIRILLSHSPVSYHVRIGMSVFVLPCPKDLIYYKLTIIDAHINRKQEETENETKIITNPVDCRFSQVLMLQKIGKAA